MAFGRKVHLPKSFHSEVHLSYTQNYLGSGTPRHLFEQSSGSTFERRECWTSSTTPHSANLYALALKATRPMTTMTILIRIEKQTEVEMNFGR